MKKALTSGQLTKKLPPIFNHYIRLRDKGKSCVSCGEYKEAYDAGHFYAKSGYAGLRFDEDNTHNECRSCNSFDESHLIGYADNLRIRIGETDFLALQERAKDYKHNGYKFGRAELREKIEYYKEKVRVLQTQPKHH